MSAELLHQALDLSRVLEDITTRMVQKAKRDAAGADETIVVGPIYMAGPITPTPGRTLEANIESAVTTLVYLTTRRVAAICPQLTGHIPVDLVPYEDWMAVDFALLASSVAVLALPGWDTSAGTRRELLYAADKGIPVFYGVRPLFDFLGVSARAARPLGAPAPAPALAPATEAV